MAFHVPSFDDSQISSRRFDARNPFYTRFGSHVTWKHATQYIYYMRHASGNVYVEYVENEVSKELHLMFEFFINRTFFEILCNLWRLIYSTAMERAKKEIFDNVPVKLKNMLVQALSKTLLYLSNKKCGIFFHYEANYVIQQQNKTEYVEKCGVVYGDRNF